MHGQHVCLSVLDIAGVPVMIHRWHRYCSIKKVWFGIDHGIRGFLVRRNGAERVYMLTLPPTPEYRALTGHDRMPALIAQDTIVQIDEGDQQMALGS